MAKHKVQDKIDAFALQAEDQVAGEMLDEFKRPMLKQFKKVKGQIENWQDVGNQLANLKNRLRVIADKDEWSETDTLNMALICAIIWNEVANGN